VTGDHHYNWQLTWRGGTLSSARRCLRCGRPLLSVRSRRSRIVATLT
jgi:hypothetical protein